MDSWSCKPILAREDNTVKSLLAIINERKDAFATRYELIKKDAEELGIVLEKNFKLYFGIEIHEDSESEASEGTKKN